jgi:cell wall-associated NlpC family hydrolase
MSMVNPLPDPKRKRNTSNNINSKTVDPYSAQKPNPGGAAALPSLDPAQTANYYAQLQGLFAQYQNQITALKQQRVGLRAGFMEAKAGIKTDLISGLAGAEGSAESRGVLGSSADAENRTNIVGAAAAARAEAKNTMRTGIAQTKLQAAQSATDYFMGVSQLEASKLASQQAALSDQLTRNAIISGLEGGGPGGLGAPPGYKGPVAEVPRNSSPVVHSIIQAANSQLGVSYRFGSYNPKGAAGGPGANLDCSAFTSFVMQKATGVSLPHSADQQMGTVPHVGRGDLKPGDLMFFNLGRLGSGQADHVGIYLGNGMMIDEASAGVTVHSVYSNYWSGFLTGGRIHVKNQNTRYGNPPRHGSPASH